MSESETGRFLSQAEIEARIAELREQMEEYRAGDTEEDQKKADFFEELGLFFYALLTLRVPPPIAGTFTANQIPTESEADDDEDSYDGYEDDDPCSGMDDCECALCDAAREAMSKGLPFGVIPANLKDLEAETEN